MPGVAALRADRGRSKGAKPLLQEVYDHYTKGFERADLKAAAHLSTKLGLTLPARLKSRRSESQTP